MSEQLAPLDGPVQVPIFGESQTFTQSVDNTSTGAAEFSSEPETRYHPQWDPANQQAEAEPEVETKVVTPPKKPARKPSKTAETE